MPSIRRAGSPTAISKVVHSARHPDNIVHYRVPILQTTFHSPPSYVNMLFSAVLIAGSLLGSALAHNIQLGAHSRECFHEQLHRDDKMTVTFQVGDREFGGSTNLDIDFWVCSLYVSIRSTMHSCGMLSP
jgi:hypothetical protein